MQSSQSQHIKLVTNRFYLELGTENLELLFATAATSATLYEAVRYAISQSKIKWVIHRRGYYIDIEASRKVNGNRQTILLAEVKCFPDPRTTTQIYNALGQYIAYRGILAEIGRIVPLYLAMPDDVYDGFLGVAIKRAIRDNHIKLIIVNLAMEAIVQWME